MTSTPIDPERFGDTGESAHARLADLEFKLAFLERELETWKDAVDGLHARLERTEAELRNALQALREGTDDAPIYGAGDSESADGPAEDAGNSTGS